MPTVWQLGIPKQKDWNITGHWKKKINSFQVCVDYLFGKISGGDNAKVHLEAARIHSRRLYPSRGRSLQFEFFVQHQVRLFFVWSIMTLTLKLISVSVMTIGSLSIFFQVIN